MFAFEKKMGVKHQNLMYALSLVSICLGELKHYGTKLHLIDLITVQGKKWTLQ